jgi:hypothetical protein
MSHWLQDDQMLAVISGGVVMLVAAIASLFVRQPSADLESRLPLPFAIPRATGCSCPKLELRSLPRCEAPDLSIPSGTQR